jgi:hypothetical protein
MGIVDLYTYTKGTWYSYTSSMDITLIISAIFFVLAAHHSRYSPHRNASKIVDLKINT